MVTNRLKLHVISYLVFHVYIDKSLVNHVERGQSGTKRPSQSLANHFRTFQLSHVSNLGAAFTPKKAGLISPRNEPVAAIVNANPVSPGLRYAREEGSADRAVVPSSPPQPARSNASNCPISLSSLLPRPVHMSSAANKVRASELVTKKRDELLKQLDELKTELSGLRVQKITGGNASKLTRM